jgi:hypothetical protein
VAMGPSARTTIVGAVTTSAEVVSYINHTPLIIYYGQQVFPESDLTNHSCHMPMGWADAMRPINSIYPMASLDRMLTTPSLKASSLSGKCVLHSLNI